MGFGLLQGLLTLLLMVLFIGIVIWAYSGRQKKRFDEASMLPFSEDEAGQAGDRNREKKHD